MKTIFILICIVSVLVYTPLGSILASLIGLFGSVLVIGIAIALSVAFFKKITA